MVTQAITTIRPFDDIEEGYQAWFCQVSLPVAAYLIIRTLAEK